MSDDEPDIETTTTTTRRIAGHDALFGTDPDELYLELRVGRPSYIRVRVGDYLQEGDAFHRDQLGMDSPTIATWEVVEITPGRVVGRDIRDDEPAEWERAAIEQGLAVGTYSTNLTDFERLSVHEVGRRGEDDGSDGEYRYTGAPYVAVVAYGDNGLKYGRRYRFADEEAATLELWTQDDPVEGLDRTVRERLDQRVREALEADGYTVAGA